MGKIQYQVGAAARSRGRPKIGPEDAGRELDLIRELFKKNPGEVQKRIKAGTSLTDQLYALFGKAAEYAGLKK